jgi:hypothetical protein
MRPGVPIGSNSRLFWPRLTERTSQNAFCVIWHIVQEAVTATARVASLLPQRLPVFPTVRQSLRPDRAAATP